jgi:lipopolysaccharide export system permease protein
MLRRILTLTLGVTVALVVMVLLITTQRLFYLLAEHVISPARFLLGLVVLSPAQCYNAAPFALALALLQTHLRWGLGHEILSLRMAGLSNWRIALPGLTAAAITTVTAGVMSAYLVPVSVRIFEDILYSARFELSLALLDEGYPQQVAPDLSISFRRRIDANDLESVTLLDGRKADSFTYIIAERASLARREGADQERVLLLQKGSYQVRGNAEEKPSPVEFDQLVLPISDSTDGSPRVRTWHGPYEQSIVRLLDPPAEIRGDVRSYTDWVALGHQRIVMPLLCLSYAVLALGMMLSAPYQRRFGPILRVVIVAALVPLWHGLLLTTEAFPALTPGLLLAYYLLVAAPGMLGVTLLLWSDRNAHRRIARIASGRPAMSSADA